jgi:hypothetical protein
MNRFLAPLAALIDLIRTAPSCGGDCSGGRRPCNCRPAPAAVSAHMPIYGAPRCVACGHLQGEPHANGCSLAHLTIRRAH